MRTLSNPQVRRLLLLLIFIGLSQSSDAMFKWKTRSKMQEQKSATQRVQEPVIANAPPVYRTENRETKTGGIQHTRQADARKGPGFGIASLAASLAAAGVFAIAILNPASTALIAVMGILAVTAVICGGIGIKEKRKGLGMAIAGFAIGLTALSLILLYGIFAFSTMV